MSDTTIPHNSSVASSQAISANASASTPGSSNKIAGAVSQLPASTPISSIENMKALDPNLYNQWAALFAQTLITDGQRYARRVEQAMRQLREGEQ